MKKEDIIIHLLGSLLTLSILYHSYSLYSILVVVPFVLVSYSVQKNEHRLLFPSLILATLAPPFFIATGSMNEIFSLLIFSITFALPLFLYWTTVLLNNTKLDWKALGFALSYVVITILAFYSFPVLLEISEFILSPENRGVQTLLFFGAGMIVAIPFHVALEIRD
ncbi:MAG: hypothetical protein V5A66_01785 [Candidatus Thermoplasmatota archaeon]